MLAPHCGLRLAHFSDVHFMVGGAPWSFRDLLSKRLTGWVHLRVLGRGNKFARADVICRAMLADFQNRRPDALVFSGDATALGSHNELEHAAQVLGVTAEDAPPGLAVPGNHDYYTRSAAQSGSFEDVFAPWQCGVRIAGHVYPFARRVGPVWLVCVNTCSGNVSPWDASGAVGAEQRERLRQLLQQLDLGPRILVTHYPVCLADGTPESRWRGLRDLADVVKIAADGGVCLWLHGHRHAPYRIAKPPLAPFPVICAGSATQLGRASYNEYVLADGQLFGTRRVFDHAAGRFRDGEQFQFRFPIWEPAIKP